MAVSPSDASASPFTPPALVTRLPRRDAGPADGNAAPNAPAALPPGAPFLADGNMGCMPTALCEAFDLTEVIAIPPNASALGLAAVLQWRLGQLVSLLAFVETETSDSSSRLAAVAGTMAEELRNIAAVLTARLAAAQGASS